MSALVSLEHDSDCLRGNPPRHAALTEHGVSHGYHEHPGGHHGIEYVLVDALAELTRIWPLEPSLKRGGAGCAA